MPTAILERKRNEAVLSPMRKRFLLARFIAKERPFATARFIGPQSVFTIGNHVQHTGGFIVVGWDAAETERWTSMRLNLTRLVKRLTTNDSTAMVSSVLLWVQS